MGCPCMGRIRIIYRYIHQEKHMVVRVCVCVCVYIIYIQNAHMYYTNEHVYFARQLYISVMVYIITNLDLLVIKHARDNGSLLHIRSIYHPVSLRYIHFVSVYPPLTSPHKGRDSSLCS